MAIMATGFDDSDWKRNRIHRGGSYAAMPIRQGSEKWQVCDPGGTVAFSGPDGAIACDQTQAKRIAAQWNEENARGIISQ